MNIHSLLIDTGYYYQISMFISILTIIYFYRYIVSIYIAIYCTDCNSYNMITIIYIVVTVFEYRYNCIEYSWYNMDSWGNDIYCSGVNDVYW